MNGYGKGDLATCIAEGKFPWFAAIDGTWTVRNDVTYREVRLSKEPFGWGGAERVEREWDLGA